MIEQVALIIHSDISSLSNLPWSNELLKATVQQSSFFVPKGFYWVETLQTSRLLGAAWSSCRWWAGWPAGWTDCQSPVGHRDTTENTTSPLRVEKQCFADEDCVRAPGSDRNRTSSRHRKGSHSCSSCTDYDLATGGAMATFDTGRRQLKANSSDMW